MTVGLLPMVDERVLTVPQVAEHLQVTEDVVRDWLRAGSLRGFRPGGPKLGWRVRESALKEFIERREADAESASRERADGEG